MHAPVSGCHLEAQQLSSHKETNIMRWLVGLFFRKQRARKVESELDVILYFL